MERTELEFHDKHRSFRFMNYFDERARRFEDLYLQLQPPTLYSVQDEDNIAQQISWPAHSYWQSYRHLEDSDQPFVILQMSNHRHHRHYQIAVQIEASNISYFQTGLIQRWILPNPNEDTRADLEALFHHLQQCLREHTKIMNLRVQLYMPGRKLLEQARQFMEDLGFLDKKSTTYVRTRLIDLRPDLEDMLNQFTANGRVRLKIKDKFKSEAHIAPVDELHHIPHLQQALHDSYQRSVGQPCHFRFLPLLKSAKKFPADISLLGFFLEEPEGKVPKAFITGVRHNQIVEFSVGGSLSDERLRKFPFNHILMWQLALKAKTLGAHFLDMGGIATNNPQLEGITNFKRSFPGFELEVGAEMQTPLLPVRLQLYKQLTRIKTTISPHIVARRLFVWSRFSDIPNRNYESRT